MSSVPLAGPSAAGVNVTEIVQVVSLPKSAVILTGHPFAAANAELEVAIEGEKLQSAEQWSVRVVPCGPLVDPSGWSVNERLVGESVTVSVRAPAVPVRSAKDARTAATKMAGRDTGLATTLPPIRGVEGVRIEFPP